MQAKSQWEAIDTRIGNFIISAIVILFASFCLIISLTSAAKSLPKSESPKDAIEIRDFKWKSGGMGTAGIIKEITLVNKGKMTYKNIGIEVNLYSTNDIPLGSLRAAINDVLEGGSEKTFYNVNLGIMHSELQKTVLRITGAELVEKGPPSLPKDLILVKNWEWSGGQYGTEGILKEITLENRSERNYKDIKIVVGNLGVGGSNKVGDDGYTSRTVIHDVLPSKSTKTFNDINVGFRHPGTRESIISVVDAKLISAKELRYRLAEKGEPVKKRTKKIAKKSGEQPTVYADDEQTQAEEKTSSDEDSKLTLAERYKQKLAKKSQETSTSQSQGTSATPGEVSMAIEPKETSSASSEDKKAATEDNAQEKEVEEESDSDGGIGGKVTKLGKRVVGIFKGDSEEIESETEETETSSSNRQENVVSAGEGEATTVREAPEEEEEEEVAIPKDDIIVKEFKWGGGVTGTIGVLDEITLENRSGINYRNIQLSVEFLGGSDNRPLGSNKITIYGSLPANSEKVFRNVKVGYLNSIPEEISIRIVDAAAIR